MAVLTLSISGKGQSKWTGNGGDSLWRNPANWLSGIAPLLLPSEDVLLDNSGAQGNYTVKITGTDSVVIHSLVIRPADGKMITVIIDSLSSTDIALSATSNEQGITISKGGIIINASRAEEGNVISITDSLRIENGALYSHRTRRAHVSLVTRLSRRPGTENGVFEFNIPSASNTLSLSNQQYGTLRLSSLEYRNPCTYSGGGVNPLIIRGNLELGTDVNFSVNFSDTIAILGHYRQSGGNFNIANSTRASTILFRGDIIQSGGTITKTGTAQPLLLLKGSFPQHIAMAGGLTGNIPVKLDNAAGLYLLTPLTIPWQLELVNGKVFTSATNLLVLASGSRILADSTSDAAFVDGPMRKEGLISSDHFLFPVGKNTVHRWLALKDATGNFTVEYIQGNPYQLSGIFGTGIDHISSVEYWTVGTDASPAASGKIILSYDENSSGGVTDLSTLRVAGNVNGTTWTNGGNERTTGSAGSSGSVQSSLYTSLSSGALFTLASSTAAQNPLPLGLLSFKALHKKDHVALDWQMSADYPTEHFEVQASNDALLFRTVTKIQGMEGISRYMFNDWQNIATKVYYRLRIKSRSGNGFLSDIVSADYNPSQEPVNTLREMVPGILEYRYQSDARALLKFELFDMAGARLMSVHKEVMAGSNMLRFNVAYLPRGAYVMHVSYRLRVVASTRFLK